MKSLVSDELRVRRLVADEKWRKIKDLANEGDTFAREAIKKHEESCRGKYIKQKEVTI
jgi:hypothetical protein